MFGNKKAKRQRLQQLTEIVQDGKWHSQSSLADKVGVTRATIFKDLPYLEDEGVLLVPHAGEMLYRLRGSVNGNQ